MAAYPAAAAVPAAVYPQGIHSKRLAAAVPVLADLVRVSLAAAAAVVVAAVAVGPAEACTLSIESLPGSHWIRMDLLPCWWSMK